MNRKIAKAVRTAYEKTADCYLEMKDRYMNLEKIIKEKYPYEKYGCTWMNVFDEKSKELEHDIRVTRHIVIGLKHLMEDAEECAREEEQKDE